MERKNLLQTEYVTEKILKQQHDSTIVLLRRRSDGSRWVYREHPGDGAVYEQLRRVRCSHLPQVAEVEAADGRVQVLEAYVQGDDLQFLLRGGPLTEAEAVKIALQLCQALEVLHGFGAVHRDIKPENILLDGDRAVLIDFDASRIQKPDRCSDTQVMGTTGYAAPEQYGFGQTDARTDIYAMGVLLNVMVTGQHPSQVLAKGRLGRIVRTCIQVHADRRYPSAKALARVLRGKNRLWWLLPAAALLAAVALLWPKAPEAPDPVPQEPQTVQTEPAPEAVPVPEAVPEPPPVEETAPEPEPDPRQTALEEAVARIWENPYALATPFSYDLDGDGTTENYRFGPYVEGFPDLILELDTVTWFPGDNDIRFRTAAPCVWRQNPNGSMEPVPEFAELLQEPQTLIYCLERTGESLPQVAPVDLLVGIWPGGATLYQHPSAAGSWLFRMTAKLGDVQLEAGFVSRIAVSEGTK